MKTLSSTQLYYLFLLFITWPVLSFGFSVTFYIFIILIFNLPRKRRIIILKTDSKSLPLQLLFIVFILSTIYTPPSINIEITRSLTILSQHLYWILIGLFFFRLFYFFDFQGTLRIIFIGTILLTLSFYFQRYLPTTSVVDFGIRRNSFVYQLLCFTPLAGVYIHQRYGKKYILLFLLVTIFIMLFTNGRAGAVIILIESIFILIMFYKNIYKIGLFFIISLLIFGTSIANYFNKRENREKIAVIFKDISPRVAELIIGEGSGDLDFDKSWLTRKLMIEKGKLIVFKYPFFGVGPLNFTSFQADLIQYKDDLDYLRLWYRLKSNDTDLNRTSPHNSYIQIMSDYGLVGFLIIVIILIKPLFFFIKRIFLNKLTIYDAPLISLFGISIHFYTISSFVGAVTWVIIGTAYSSMNLIKKLKL